MADVVKSVGATGRDYATLAAFMAAVPANLTAAVQRWIAQLYPDANFNITASVDFGTHTTDGVNYIWVTCAPGYEIWQASHPKFVFTAAPPTNPTQAIHISSAPNSILEHIEFTYTGGASANEIRCLRVSSTSYPSTIRWCRVHDVDNGAGARQVVGISGQDGSIMNCVVYNIGNAGQTSNTRGIGSSISGAGHTTYIQNNTVYNVLGLGDAAIASSANAAGGGTIFNRNNVAIRFDANKCLYYEVLAGGVVTATNNASSDATADDFAGAGHLINIPTAQFVDPSTGDFRLRGNSVLRGAGANLGAGPWSIDQRGYDRANLAPAVPWDMGAIQFPPYRAELLRRGQVRRARRA